MGHARAGRLSGDHSRPTGRGGRDTSFASTATFPAASARTQQRHLLCFVRIGDTHGSM
jgi:hypothetical protein